jgi:hypothetical protein
MVQQKYVNDLIKYYTCTIHGTVKTFWRGCQCSIMIQCSLPWMDSLVANLHKVML